jgi:hypothetical protein
MFDRLKPAVLSLLHSVLGKMTSSSELELAVLPSHTEHIVPYSQRMFAIKRGDGITLLRKWQVRRARVYKSQALSEHEYISITVVDSQNKTSYIAIERHRGDFIIPNDTNIKSEPTGFSASNSSISSISSLSSVSDRSTRAADDRITPIPNSSGMWNKNDELIYELNFTKPFYLYELVLLAVIVHGENTSYLLTTNNCYHFAGTIIKVLEEEHNIKNDVKDAGAGKWCGLTIYSGKKDGNASFLLEKYRESIKNFVSILYF